MLPKLGQASVTMARFVRRAQALCRRCSTATLVASASRAGSWPPRRAARLICVSLIGGEDSGGCWATGGPADAAGFQPEQWIFLNVPYLTASSGTTDALHSSG